MFLIVSLWRCSFTTILALAVVAILNLLGMALGLMVSERHWAVATGPGRLANIFYLLRLIREAPLRSSLGVWSIAVLQILVTVRRFRYILKTGIRFVNCLTRLT